MARDNPAIGPWPDSGELFDELLVTLIQSGNRQAAGKLARRWQPRLLRTARRLLVDEEDARTAVQHSWVAILGGIARLKDPARFRAWAFTILRRRCADRIRDIAARRAGEAEAPEDIASGATPPNGEDRVAVLQAFAILPPEQRLAAQLFFVEGLTLSEIAEVQCVPLGTAKSRLFHARRRLKAALT